MFGWWDEFLKEVLPTKWMQRTAATTVPLSLGALWLPDVLLKLELLTAPQITLQLRLLLALSVLCIGISSLLVLALVHIHKIKSLKPTAPNRAAATEIPIPDLEEPARTIFIVVGNLPGKSTNTIATELKMNQELCLHHLEWMEKLELVAGSYAESGRYWRATTRGREYMAKKKLFINKPAKPKDWRI